VAKLSLPWQVASRGVTAVLGFLWGIRFFFALVAQSLAVPVLRVGVLTLYIAPLMGVPAGQAGMPLKGASRPGRPGCPSSGRTSVRPCGVGASYACQWLTGVVCR
jgi:hypothetical protein